MRRTGQPDDRDVTLLNGDVGALGLGEFDRGLGALDDDLAEPPGAVDFGPGDRASTREPVGSCTVTSAEPELPSSGSVAGAAVIRRTPSAYATSVRSAASTSVARPGSAARISTVVSARSEAAKRMRPAGMSSAAAMADVVGKVCVRREGRKMSAGTPTIGGRGNLNEEER